MTPDLTALDALLRHRERIVELLAARGAGAPRVAGLAAVGRTVPPGVPIELYVAVAGARDWHSADLARLDAEIGALIGHPVVVIDKPSGGEGRGPDEYTWML